MKNYFQKFKDLESKSEDKKLIIETPKKEPLARRIFYKGPELFLDNEKAFTLPAENAPYLTGVIEKEDNSSIIYAVTRGIINRLTLEDEIITLTHRVGVDIHISDILPVARDNDSTLLMCGKIMAPSYEKEYGVRMLDLYLNNNSINILTLGSEIRDYERKDVQLLLRLDDNKISLHTYEENRHPSSNVTGISIKWKANLNSYLMGRGVDIEKTIKMQEYFTKRGIR